MIDPRFVAVGRIVGVFGVKGWVKVYSDTDPPNNLLNYSPWYLSHADGWQLFTVAEAKPHGKGLVARLHDCQDRDQASTLVGRDIAVQRQQLANLAPGEYYWIDLVGLSVVNLAGLELGKISHLFATGSNDVLVVKPLCGKEQWIPYVPGRYVVEVNLSQGCITVDWDLEEDPGAV
ncbi:MAG: ribosome maturation factor RimM [Gammaproteobacteria bacterium]|nr:ribosome maturation factor RimM [Gammaproteobacteria bacterium]